MPPEAPDSWADIVQLVELSRSSPAPLFTPVRPAHAPRRRLHMVLRFLLLVLLPTLLAGTYFGFIAADRYVSEARFIVRKPESTGRATPQSLSVEETTKGIGSDDSYAVRDFMMSRDGLRLLLDKADLRDALTRGGRDLFWRFPGPLTGSSDEALYRLYQSIVSVDYDGGSGLTTLRTQGFDPATAQRLASVLMVGAEDLLNRLNDRAHSDAIRVAEAEVARSKAEAVTALDNLTAFRTREAVIDPTQFSKTVLDTIGALSLQMVEASAQLDMTQHASPNSPQLAPLRSRIRAIQAQMDRERATLAGTDRSLAPQVAEYERLALQRSFAEKSFESALNVLEMARLDAERQQSYIERVVTPQQPDRAVYPYRILWISGVFAAGLGMFWLFRPVAAPRGG